MAAEILTDTIKDSVRLLPFLYITYIFIELIELGVWSGGSRAIRRSGLFAPIIGALLGAVPQCGLSAAAAGFYCARAITLGTMLSVFLSCSDEMLPVLIAQAAPLSMIAKILIIKVIMAAVSGLITDVFLRFALPGISKARGRSFPEDAGRGKADISSVMPHNACGCGAGGSSDTAEGRGQYHFAQGIFLGAFRHTMEVFLYIFVISFLLNAIMEGGGEDIIRSLFTSVPVVGELIASLIGLIPNCASSVALTELYMAGAIGSGAVMAGLLTNSGVGLLVLLRQNKNIKENALIIVFLCVLGISWGMLTELIGITF